MEELKQELEQLFDEMIHKNVDYTSVSLSEWQILCAAKNI